MLRPKKSPKGMPKVLGAEPSSAKKIAHQSDYGQTPWKPGEVPSMRNGSRMPVYGMLEEKAVAYGETLGVQVPANRGSGYSPIRDVDIETHETRVKQPGPRHGGPAKV